MELVWFKHVRCILNNLIAINGFYLSLEIQKLLTKLSKEKNCEIIGRWKKACVRHFYWAVTSTQECLGQVKLANFKPFLVMLLTSTRTFQIGCSVLVHMEILSLQNCGYPKVHKLSKIGWVNWNLMVLQQLSFDCLVTF